MESGMKCSRCGRPIDEHEAGRETDYCIAEVVLNLTCLHDPQTGILLPVDIQVKQYSTDLSAAMERVVFKLKTDGAAFGIKPSFGRAWQAEFYVPLTKDDARRAEGYGNWKYWARAETLPLAICHAALKLAIDKYCA